MNNNSIKIIATKRTCKVHAENKYDIIIETNPEKIYIYDIVGNYLEVRKEPYGNNTEIIIECHRNVHGYYMLSDKEYYTKKELLEKVEHYRKFLQVTIEFDENTWTPSKTWSVDLSKQITVKVLKPSGMQFMGSMIVEGEVFTTIDNTPPDYPVDYGYVDYDGHVCENVVQLVHTLFRQIDVLGTDVKIDGKTLSYADALNTKPRNIKLIEIFL